MATCVDRGVAETARAAAMRGLAGVRAAFDGERWGDAYELMFGNAGIGLAALRLGDPELAEAAVAPYLRTAETDPVRPDLGAAARAARAAAPHFARHAGHRLRARGDRNGGRPPATSSTPRWPGSPTSWPANEAGPDGFLVPHSDPQQVAFGLERYSYGWCHGPAGDAQVFRLLAQLADAGAGGGDGWRALVDRCWQTVTTSGLPERLRPGFWDNSGRCCGTGGVLALALRPRGRERRRARLRRPAGGRPRPAGHGGRRRRPLVERRVPRQPAGARAPAGLGDGQRRAGQRAAAARADHGRARSVLRGPVARPPGGRTGGRWQPAAPEMSPSEG